ncbi:MAG: metallophosphoesterase family protein [Clostridia bacterium]|nr:metallophosphoesterase family protein [Clostridia bacterium]
MQIAVLSDTHNLLRPEVLARVRGCDAILHGGDISRQSVLDQLQQLAPVHAVRGNNDGDWADLLLFLDITLGGLRLYMAHKKKDLPRDLTAYDLVVYGHSHQYAEDWQVSPQTGRRQLLLNPGSCGPRRFLQPVTMAMLTIPAEGGWSVSRIDFPHSAKETAPSVGPGIRKQIELVIRETQKGRSPADIAQRTGMDAALAEQIARLYVTHPGVTVDGIMTKMGL